VGEGYTDHLLDEVASDHRLTTDQIGDLRALILQWQQWSGGRSSVNADAFVALLCRGRVSAAFAEYWQPANITSLESWMNQRRLVETLAGSHPDHPGVNYLRAMIALRLGDGSAALGFLEKSHRDDEAFVPTRDELGVLVLDLGDIQRALNLLPTDAPGAEPVRSLTERARAARSGAERGEPCPCGSRKKYRSCCARHFRLSRAERDELLDLRLGLFLTSPPWSVQMDRLADVVSTEWGLMSFPEALAEPFVQDVLVIEGGGAGAYLAARRGLFEQADIEMLAQFTSRHRDAFDIVGVVGDTMSLADPDTGQCVRMSVLDVQGTIEQGDAVLVRTVETDGAPRAVGPALRIPATHVPLLRVVLASGPTAEQLLGWVCRRSEILRPPIDLTGDIDLREDTPALDEVLAAIDLDDLARRALG
jgi:hypothetical protein